MIITYKTCMAGPYHIKNNIPCQDSYAVKVSDEGYSVAAVADGLGSVKYSDIGSKVASDTVTAYCVAKLKKDMSEEEIKEIMYQAFIVANLKVYKTAEQENNDAEQYDTTLCLAVYDGETLYYGQSGDSGILALCDDGEYMQVTKQQRDENGYVYPLCFGESYWEFSKVDKPVAGVLLMTDGVFENIFPPIMKNEKVPINIPLAEQALNYFDIEEDEVGRLEELRSEYWANFPEYALDDDKTTVALINIEKQPLRKEDDYYALPDWATLMEKATESRSDCDDIEEPSTETHEDVVDDNPTDEKLDFIPIDKKEDTMEPLKKSVTKMFSDVKNIGENRLIPIMTEVVNDILDDMKKSINKGTENTRDKNDKGRSD